MASEAYQGRPALLRRPGSLAAGGWVLAFLLAAALVSALNLGLFQHGFWPTAGGWQLAGEFFSQAWRPSLRFMGENSPQGAWDLPLQALTGAAYTVVFAAAAMSLALVGGLVLGFFGSSMWWDLPDRSGARIGPAVTALTRTLMTIMRSIHELVWAVLLLAALGMGELVAVIAIAIPYAGTLGKIFSEMLDETSGDGASALRLSGAPVGSWYALGLLPGALPDMLGYAFYRFECALRSSAVLGFFGFPTLGYFISASFENLYFAEVWSYLYVLMALILFVDWWSGRLRKAVRS
jgi:phosphonate transport system permease protein